MQLVLCARTCFVFGRFIKVRNESFIFWTQQEETKEKQQIKEVDVRHRCW